MEYKEITGLGFNLISFSVILLVNTATFATLVYNIFTI